MTGQSTEIAVLTRGQLYEIIRKATEEGARRLLTEIEPPVANFEWISNTEAMRLLDVSRSTLQRWRDSEGLPYSKVRSTIFYRRSELSKWLSGRRVQ